MNFQQLRIIQESIRCNFNLTEVASNLFTSPSGVSKHIKDLEDELGIEIFIRKGKRVLEFTEPGKELSKIVNRILLDTKNLKNLADVYSNHDSGQIVIATTHTQARYALPGVITKFKQQFPKVHLALYQGSPAEIVNMLLNGTADIGIASEALKDASELVTFPYYSWHHAVIVPVGHPLAGKHKITLEDIAAYPIVTYHDGFTGRKYIDKTFAEAGLLPDIVMSALDADVIKTYVELGLGIGIIASVAFNPSRDIGLVYLPGEHLFKSNNALIALRKGNYLRGFACAFVEYCAPEVTYDILRDALSLTSDEVA